MSQAQPAVIKPNPIAPRRGASAWPNHAADYLLYRPEPDAAGRVSIYRIVYGLFYLWHVALYPAANLSDAPEFIRHGSIFLDALRRLHVPYVEPQVLEFGLVASLVALILGWRTRVATLLVLVFGGVIEAQFAALDIQRARMFLAFYLPLMLLVAGDWGACYSLDAVRRRRRATGRSAVDPHSPHARYFLPARATLLILGLLFLHAALAKTVLPGGTWLHEPSLMADVAMTKNIKAALYDLPMTPVIPAFAARPWLYGPSLYGVLVFEATFVLAVLGRPLRRFYVWTALSFHTANAVLLLVTFTPVLVIYPLFLNLQCGADWVGRHLPAGVRDAPRLLGESLARRPTWLVSTAALLLSIGFAAAWQSGPWLGRVLTLGGLLDWQTINLPLLPFAVVGTAWATLGLFVAARNRLRRRPAAATTA